MTPRLHDGEPVDAFQSFDPDAYDPYQAPERCPGCNEVLGKYTMAIVLRNLTTEKLAPWCVFCAAQEWLERLAEGQDEDAAPVRKLDKLAIGQLYGYYLIRGKAHQEFEEVVA